MRLQKDILKNVFGGGMVAHAGTDVAPKFRGYIRPNCFERGVHKGFVASMVAEVTYFSRPRPGAHSAINSRLPVFSSIFTLRNPALPRNCRSSWMAVAPAIHPE